MQEKGDQPFFLGWGFKLPHLDWIAPKRYWDMYDPEKIPMANQDESPKGGAAMGLHVSFELRVRQGIPKYRPILFYAGTVALGLIILYHYLPETKNLSIEEIQAKLIQ